MATDLSLAFQFENGLAFTETDIAIFSGNVDPSVGAGTPAPRGSLFLRDNGELYIKSGESDASWNWHLQNGDVEINVVQPSSGLTISGGPIQNAGTLTFTLANDLAALEGLSSSGLASRIGADTWVTRVLTGTAGNVVVDNGDGIAGNPTINLVPAGAAGTYGSANSVPVFTTDTFGRVVSVAPAAISLSLDDLSDVIISSPTNGQVLSYNGVAWVNSAQTGGTGTVTSVAATAPTAGFTISGSPITTAGTLVFTLANDLAAVEGLTTTGIAVRTGADTWATRTLVGGQNITISVADGSTANPTIALSGIIPTANGGTGLATIGTALQVLRVNAAGTALEYASAGNGTVTSVDVTQPAAGLTITGAPITSAGTLVFALANDLAAIETLNGTGFYTRIDVDTWAARSLTAPASGITITHPAGVGGNPTFALANDLAAVEGLTTTGIAVRTGADTWATRAIQGTTNQITVADGAGTSANPTVAIAPNPVLPGTEGVVVPTGTTAERPAVPLNGEIRYNSTLNATEIYQNGQWYQIGTVVSGGVGILAVYTGIIPSTSGTSAVPYDNTTPTITEGSEIWSTAISPSKSTSTMKFTVPFTVDSSTSNRIVIASLFRGSLNIGSAVWYATGGGRPTTITLAVSDSPATTNQITYSMRVGIGAGSGTWYVNSTSAGNDLGGALVSSYEITEVG
jgi:hypothetical protein